MLDTLGLKESNANVKMAGAELIATVRVNSFFSAMKELTLGQLTICAVCENDKACAAFQPRFPGDETSNDGIDNDDDQRESDMVCYKGGLAVQQNYQMCDVTSEYRGPLPSPEINRS
jgi:hypothetical protein